MFDGGWPMRQFSCPPLLAPRYQKRAPRRREGREGTADEGWRMFDGGWSGGAAAVQPSHSRINEVVEIDPLDLIVGSGRDSNSMVKHQLGQTRTIDQDDLGLDPGRVIKRIGAE